MLTGYMHLSCCLLINRAGGNQSRYRAGKGCGLNLFLGALVLRMPGDCFRSHSAMPTLPSPSPSWPQSSDAFGPFSFICPVFYPPPSLSKVEAARDNRLVLRALICSVNSKEMFLRPQGGPRRAVTFEQRDVSYVALPVTLEWDRLLRGEVVPSAVYVLVVHFRKYLRLTL